MAISRRDFIKWSAAAGTWMYVSGLTGSAKMIEKAVALPIPGGTLDPLTVPKFVTPLLIPPVMPKAATLTGKGKSKGKPIDYYEISVRQFAEQILPTGLPATTVWGYGAVTAASKKGLKIHNAPSLTIEATHGVPTRVKWINELKDAAGAPLPHLLPVDQTLHWANPPGGVTGRDTRPTFTSTPGTYTGPVPQITHVHGAVGVPDWSDGYAEAWYLPAGADATAYATEGTWYSFFKSKAAAALGVTWAPGSATFEYPNLNRASTVWYHDHTLGMTRVNVYAGPAGFYLVRGGPDDVVRDTRTGLPGVLPGPAPKEGDAFPPNKKYYEIPIAIQDRAFNADGSLFYPDTREFFDGATATMPGYIPDTDLAPIWNPEFFGNMIMVNGNTWPFLNVEKRRYRFRFLNGCQARFLILDFKNIPGVEVWQIGNEGGFLAAPVNLTATANNELLMGLAERADVIVDFTNVAPGSYELGNVGPDEPFNGDRSSPSDALTTGRIMRFNVAAMAAGVVDPSTPPAFLQLPPVAPLPAPIRTRRLALLEMMSMSGWDGPAEAMLGTVGSDGMPVHSMWMDAVTEDPAVGDTEIWEFYNFTGDAHPMHVHEVVFEVLNREGLVLDSETEEPVVPVQLAGSPRPSEPTETGFKDTVIAYPGEVTRIKATFKTPGQFTWHCHIVEHEDNEMMRPYRIGPPQGGPGGA